MSAVDLLKFLQSDTPIQWLGWVAAICLMFFYATRDYKREERVEKHTKIRDDKLETLAHSQIESLNNNTEAMVHLRVIIEERLPRKSP